MSIEIVYRPGKNNADTVSSPYIPAPPGNDTGTAVSANTATHVSADFGEEQRKDPNLKLLIFAILVDGTQPDDELLARKVIGQRQTL